MFLYTAVYLMSNFLVMLAIERFMSTFFVSKKNIVMIILYMFYFVSSSIAFLLINIPIVSMTTAVFSFFIISLNYESLMIKKLVVAVYCCFFFIVVDIITTLIVCAYPINLLVEVNYDEIMGFVITGILTYSLAVLLRKFNGVRKNSATLPMFWVSALLIPIASIFIVFLILFSANNSQLTASIAIAVMFGINLLIFYLHDALSVAYEDKMQSMLHAQEKDYFYSQYQIMQESVSKIRAFRHDIKNHLATLRNFSAKGNTGNVTEYLEHLLCDIKESEVYSNSGNLTFDSIINYKLKNVKADNIKVDIEILIPPSFNIVVTDVVTILGNLLDNALEAVNASEDKWIRLTIEFDKATLFIKIENSFSGEIRFLQDKDPSVANLASLKSGEEHGYGLKNIYKTVEKYDGHIKITYTENIFSVGILLCIE